MPQLRRACSAGWGLAKSCCSASPACPITAKSALRARSYWRSSRGSPTLRQYGRVFRTRTSSATSASPRFKPCPVSGCTLCAASPASTHAPCDDAPLQRRASACCNGHTPRLLVKVIAPTAPWLAASSSRQKSSSGAACRNCARSGLTDHTSAHKFPCGPPKGKKARIPL